MKSKSGEELIEQQDSAETCFYDSTFDLRAVNITDIKDYQDGITSLWWWENKSGDNYDDYHTNRVLEMMDMFKEDNEALYPIILNKSLKLYDGHHRLTALNELGFKKIQAWVERC